MDANINGLRNLLDYARAAPRGGPAAGGLPVLLVQRDLRRPGAGRHPHPRDLPRQRLLHRAAGLLRRVEAVRRDAVRQLRPPARHPGHHGAPVQQLRPGDEDHRRPRHRRPFRDALAGRDLVLLSDGSPTRTFCYVADAVTGYYLALLRGRPGEAYNVGVDGPEISMRDLAGDDRRAGQRPVRPPGARWSTGAAPRPTTWSTTPTVAAPTSPRPGQELGYRPRSDARGGAPADAAAGTAGTASGEER